MHWTLDSPPLPLPPDLLLRLARPQAVERGAPAHRAPQATASACALQAARPRALQAQATRASRATPPPIAAHGATTAAGTVGATPPATAERAPLRVVAHAGSAAGETAPVIAATRAQWEWGRASSRQTAGLTPATASAAGQWASARAQKEGAGCPLAAGRSRATAWASRAGSAAEGCLRAGGRKLAIRREGGARAGAVCRWGAGPRGATGWVKETEQAGEGC